jgi:hypothetical protein
MTRLTTWGEVINSLSTLDADDLVCFDGGPSSPEDPCLVANGRDLDPDEDVPPEAASRGWHTVLTKDEISGVISNLTKQVDDPDLDLILRAVAYFVDHDAYLTVS